MHPRDQGDREDSVAQFKSGQSPLIATDVAALALDIKGVEYVINYTFPLTTEGIPCTASAARGAPEERGSSTFFRRTTKAEPASWRTS